MLIAAPQSPLEKLMEDALGPSASFLVAGNGRLTTGVDQYGSVRVCRWPGPCSPNQIANDSPGLFWNVEFADQTPQTSSFSHEKTTPSYKNDKTTLVDTYLQNDSGDSVHYETLVHASRDILATRIACSSDFKARFWAPLAPVCNAIPEWAVLDGMNLPNSGFGLFFDAETQTFCHFRPKQAGAAEWERLAHDVQNPSEADWACYGEGVWCLWGSPNEIESVYCGTASPHGPAIDGPAERTWAVEGGKVAGATLAPSGEKKSAVVFIAFGRTLADAAQNLKYAMDKGFDALAEETDKAWADTLALAALPEDLEIVPRCRRDLLTILQNMDRDSDAVAMAPGKSSFGAFDSPSQSVWPMLALDLVGLTDLAGKHADYLTKTVRKEDRPGRPKGSVPAATFADGLDAFPSAFLDPEAAAWLLAALWRHATCLGEEERRQFLLGKWETVEIVAGFLAGWWDERQQEPMRAPVSPIWRDTPEPMRYLTAYMGLDAAIRTATTINYAVPPEWRQRKRVLDGLIRLNCLDPANGQWKPDALLPFWRPELAEAGLPSMKQPLMESLEMTPNEETLARRRILYDLALVSGKQKDTRESLRADWINLIRPWHEGPGTEAARDLITAHILYTKD